MELEIAFGHRQQSGMDEQDRVSQASSVVTVLSTRDQTDKKPQSFCKRSRSVQRDPNCAVVIRGWLYKRDSTGLKLWKRRWFVLSNYCLFYYKDSREECVLGSLPLPSYKIFFCSPRECKNRKYAFKVVHQGMRSYFFSAETQEDMLGWVRALSQSACMENDDLINRRCSSYHDFSQLGGNSESVNPLHVYRTQNKASHCAAGGEDTAVHRGRDRDTQNSGIRTRSLSLDRTGEDHFLYQGSGPSTPRSHYESRSHSPLLRGDLRSQVYSTHYSPVHKAESKGIHSDQLPPLPPSRITHNPPGPFHHSIVSGEKESHTLTALQGDTDMVLTCLCGCDKVLQTLSVELDLLQQDKEHAEFALDMSRVELGEGQLNEYYISQKALLQEELVTIRARMCDISQEMEKVWLDYKRMESELCVFRSHLEHICHFGLPQESSLAQKQIWMMDDILSGLKPNRSRFKALMALHTPTMFPLLHNSPLHPEESMHYWGEELEPPARPPLPLELDSTKQGTKRRPEWVEPNYRMVYNPATMNTHASTHTNTDTAESESLCLDEESDHPKQMHWKFDKNKLHHKKRSQSPDHQMTRDDKPHTLTESSPVCVMRLMRAELPSALTAQRVCVEESNPEEDELNTLSDIQGQQIDNNNVNICALNRESSLAMISEQRHAKLKRVERIRERVLKSALRRSDSAHPLKFVGVRETGNRSESVLCKGQRSTGSVQTDLPPSLHDINPSSTNHISTLTINNMSSEETDQSLNCSTSTNQRAEWFLSTSHWQDFIPLNIQEEELSPTNQDSELSLSLVTMETTDQNMLKCSDPLSSQSIGISSDSHVNVRSESPRMELCIYEEIQHKAPKSFAEDDGSVVGGAKAQLLNYSTNHNADSHLSLNQNAYVDVGIGEGVEMAKEAGSDIIISAKATQPTYSRSSKSSATNHTASFLKPRVTVVSTSL